MTTSQTWVQRDFGLDRRLIKALSKVGYTYPTNIQAAAIPTALEGKDVLVRSHTGTGKTVAFALPLLHKLLCLKDEGTSTEASIKAIILAPTKELCKQIEKNMKNLMFYCRDTLSVCSLSDDKKSGQVFHLQNKPDIVISTPARIVQHMKSELIDLSSLQTLVIDEADLVLSLGYLEDVQQIINQMPKIVQGMLVSATLSPELEKFKRIVLHNPVVIMVQDNSVSSSDGGGSGAHTAGENAIANLQQFYLNTTEADKFLILYVFIKLGLLQGKGIIFVNDVNKCYKVKLFLQQFFISAAVLNAELPLNCRLHIVEEYNRGVFDYLIATDASVDYGEVNQKEEESGSEEEEEAEEEDESASDSGSDSGSEDEVEEGCVPVYKPRSQRGVPKGKGKGKTSVFEKASSSSSSSSQAAVASDYGVSRGIDFVDVAFVINFDFPVSSASYTHRIGRTARAGNAGTALSFVSVIAHGGGIKTTAKEQNTADRDADILALVQATQPKVYDPTSQTTGGPSMIAQPSTLMFNTQELETFRYRVYDVLRSITSAAVREIRAAEIKREILNSQKLKSFFSENPNDLKVLRHDKAVLHPIRQMDHLKAVPEYLVPSSMRSMTANNGKMGKNKGRKRRDPASASAGSSVESRIKKSKMKDPLYGGGDDDENDGGIDVSATGQTSYVNDDSSFSTAGRNEWKMRHNKGKYNERNAASDSFKPGPQGNLAGKKSAAKFRKRGSN